MGVARGEGASAQGHLHGDLEASPVAGQEGGPEEGPPVVHLAARPALRAPFAAKSVTATVPFASVVPRCRAAVAVTLLQEVPRPEPQSLRKTSDPISVLRWIASDCYC